MSEVEVTTPDNNKEQTDDLGQVDEVLQAEKVTEVVNNHEDNVDKNESNSPLVVQEAPDGNSESQVNCQPLVQNRAPVKQSNPEDKRLEHK